MMVELERKIKWIYHEIEHIYYKLLDKTLAKLILRYVDQMPYNPEAVINRELVKGASGVTPLRTDDRKDIGLAQVRRTPTLKAYLAIFGFVRKGGKLIYIPMWAGIPRPEEVRMYSGAGHATVSPAEYLKVIPTVSLSLTDFLPMGRFYPLNTNKKYDFMIVTWGGDIKHKRWDLVLELIEKLCPSFKMVVIAYKGTISKKELKIINKYKEDGQLTFINSWVSKDDFPKILNQSKVMIVPSEWDNHPRIMDQALLCNVPLAVNKDIYGGKKLITERTGGLASPEKLAECAVWVLENLAEKDVETRTWYLKNHGSYNAFREYTKFINDIFDTNYRVVYLENKSFILEKDYLLSIGDLPDDYDDVTI